MNTIKEYLLFDLLSIETSNPNENHDGKLKFQVIEIVLIGIILQNIMHLVEDIFPVSLIWKHLIDF